MIVSALKGNTVNLREEPNTSSKILCTIPVGTTIDNGELNGEWYKINYGGKTGYMMSKFLKESSGTVTKSDLQRIYDALAAALKTIEEVMK